MTAPYKLVRLSGDADCMLDIDVEKMARVWRKAAVVKRIESWLTDEVFRRKFATVAYEGALYWADLATGTLYTLQGACMSSGYLLMLDD